jgi:hypothetical protein
MAVYGLQKDINANQGRNVILYTPGKTQLSPTDVFLGGTATGVNDNQLNGATRVYGNTAKDTANALSDYNNDLFSQTKSAIAQNAAPRADASRGAPTLARQAQEIAQAQGKISNDMNAAQLTGSYNNAPTLAQKTFNQNVAQDTFSNDLARQAQSIQSAQNKATFDYNKYNDAANRAANIQKASAPTAAETKAANTVDAYGDVDDAISQGTPWETIRQKIMDNASGYAQAGLSFTTILDYAEAKYGAAQESYTASMPTLAESQANSLTNSVFKDRGSYSGNTSSIGGWLNNH